MAENSSDVEWESIPIVNGSDDSDTASNREEFSFSSDEDHVNSNGKRKLPTEMAIGKKSQPGGSESMNSGESTSSERNSKKVLK